jgi:hypothetical protein
MFLSVVISSWNQITNLTRDTHQDMKIARHTNAFNKQTHIQVPIFSQGKWTWVDKKCREILTRSIRNDICLNRKKDHRDIIMKLIGTILQSNSTLNTHKNDGQEKEKKLKKTKKANHQS